MEEIAQRIVRAIEPSTGWWKDDTRDTLEDAAITMLNEGMDDEMVEETLHRVVSAMQEEYGE